MQGLEVLNCQNWNWKVYVYCLYFILFCLFTSNSGAQLSSKVPAPQMQCKMMSQLLGFV